MRRFDTAYSLYMLEITLIIQSLMVQYSALSPVVCPKECSCGSIFGLKPYVKCDNVQSGNVYKVMIEIPQNTEEMQKNDKYISDTPVSIAWKLSQTSRSIIEELLNSESQRNFTAVFICKQEEDIFNEKKQVVLLFVNYNQAFGDSVTFNDITTVQEDTFQSLVMLQQLDLSANNIKKIPSLSALSSIKFLYLSNNQIRMIESKAFDDLRYLSMLLLSGNEINTLPEKMALQFHLMDLSQIILHDNPLTCSCKNRWLISWQKKRCDLHHKTKECALMCFQNGTSISMEKFDMNNLTCGCKARCYCSTQSVESCKVTCYDDSDSEEIQTTQCSSCPKGSHPLYDWASECVCQKGYTLVDGVCEQCPEGSFKSFIGPAACTPCPQYSTSQIGSTSEEQCVCQYGEFKILSDQERKCQRYENEEFVRLGMEPVVTFAPEKNDQMTEYENRSKTPDGVVFGVVGIVIVLFFVGVGFTVYKWKQTHRTYLKFPKLLMCKSSYQYEERHESLIYSTKLKNYYKGLKVASGQLKIGKLIGRGAFGMVHEGYLRDKKDENTKRVAIKRLKEDATREEQEALQMELDHMMYVGKHPNIIELIGLCSMKGSLMLVLEYACNGDLLSYLRRCSTVPGLQLNSPGFGPDKAAVVLYRTLVMFAWHVSKGMCHLEKLKCIHRDIAARNILLTQDPIAKISDFGLSRDVYESAYYFKVSKGRLPFKWMSPEALLMGQYSIKSDVWSFGILLWEVVTLGGNPFAGIPVESLCEMYANNYRLPKPATCPDYQYKLMLECWAERTQERPSFNEIEARLDGMLQRVANRDYINVMEEGDILVCHNNDVTDSRENITTCLSTDSDDRTFHESSDSDSITEKNSEMLSHHPRRSHPPRKTSKESATDRQSVTLQHDKESSRLVKSMSSIELQNLPDYKIQMWSNPIYGSRRKLKETKCT
ncbi:vascular endothelial growth factor receptor 3-like [Saccostrea echinata]|uniref:vascular endothelial growth factor receptor 3-like n=1 Tax=Saccostrea echinata TaxID=191078 RepID=UPI002A7FD9E4|nr:vascular endothelial growth factor receptor 3-like [Saccostrea echinata]